MSPDGCQMFTAARQLHVQNPAHAPFINYLVCLAVTRGVRAALEDALQGLPLPDVRIKWPNDIYTSSGLKIGGTLIHTTWQRDRFNVVTGIGLNVSNRHPTTCLEALVAEAAAAHGVAAPPRPSLTREAVLAAVLGSLEDVFEAFEAHGFGPLEAEYLAAWLHSGQQLAFEEDEGGGGGGEAGGRRRTVALTIRGLSPSGFLMAQDAAGRSYELTPDGNSLDMMKGLIRRKLPAPAPATGAAT